MQQTGSRPYHLSHHSIYFLLSTSTRDFRAKSSLHLSSATMRSSPRMSSFFIYAQLAIFLIVFSSQGLAEEVFYSIDEEVDAGYFVGNLAVDLAIDPESQFSMLTVPNETYFTLDTETGTSPHKKSILKYHFQTC